MKQLFGSVVFGFCAVYMLGGRALSLVPNIVDGLSDELEIAMTKGCDDRLIPMNDGLNKYFTCMRPRPTLIARSSSTSSNSSRLGYLAAQQLFNRLQAAQADGGAARYFEYSMDHIRQQIKQFWGASAAVPCHVITTPSGSNAEMIPTLAALLRNSQWVPGVKPTRPLVVNVIVASGEVGSSSALASKLCHISNLTPIGTSVALGTQIGGVEAGVVEVVEVKIRDAQGMLMPEQDMESKIATIVQRAIEQGQTVVLHLVHACKTGASAPRESFVRDLKQKYKDDLVVIVDAAQLRMNEEAVGQWLDQNFMVFLTGSKFLGGPSFEAAVLIPHHEAVLFAASSGTKIPAGFSDYLTPADFDQFFENVQRTLPTWYNVGLALRWSAALAEADRFFAINPAQRDRGVGYWARGVRSIVKKSKSLVPFEELFQGPREGSLNSFIGKCNSIVLFGVRLAQDDGSYKFLNFAQLRKMYELMTMDLSGRLKNLSPELQSIAATPCLIGQPVQIATAGPCTSVLRIAIAVPEIFKSIGHERVDPAVLIDELLEEDRLVVRKLDLIAANWAELIS